jgi:hypothetical protein
MDLRGWVGRLVPSFQTKGTQLWPPKDEETMHSGTRVGRVRCDKRLEYGVGLVDSGERGEGRAGQWSRAARRGFRVSLSQAAVPNLGCAALRLRSRTWTQATATLVTFPRLPVKLRSKILAWTTLRHSSRFFPISTVYLSSIEVYIATIICSY